MLTGILAGLAAGALWGLVFVAPLMVPGLSEVDLAAGRFVSYGAFSIVLLLLARKPTWPTQSQAMAAVGLSILGFSGYYLLLVYAIRDAGTEVPSLVIGTIPLWMMLLGKPNGLRWRSLIPGLVLTSLGLVLMVYAVLNVLGDVPSKPSEGVLFWRGIALAVCAMVLWTAFGLLNAAWLKKHTDVAATTWANWLGVATGLGAVLLWWVAGSDINMLLNQSNRAQAAIICIATGIGSAWLATIFWNVASQRLTASLCGQLIVSETIFALLYAFWWRGEWPSTLQALACVLFASGILASIRAHR